MNLKVLIPAAMWTVATAFAFSVIIMSFSDNAIACGLQKTDGKSFTMDQTYTPIAQNGIISKSQAIEIVSQHISRLNPNLRVGQVNDDGRLYRAEILSPTEGKIQQVIGVYKDSGQLVDIN